MLSAMAATASPVSTQSSRHSALVRVTHWLTVLCFFTLLVTGAEIVISHPRFYWGEVGNVNTHPLFVLPIPASRNLVPTGYSFVLSDQNGWSRYLHFQTAWILVLTGLVYGVAGFLNGHFRRNLLPPRGQRTGRAYTQGVARSLRKRPADPAEEHSYNVLQRTAYLVVVFVLFPLIVWTGLALSPAFDSAIPAAVNLLGGRQSARTLHFFVTDALVLFLIVHVTMIALSGFWRRMRAMTIGSVIPRERP